MLYLFDVDLADGDGIELARSLSEAGPRLPVVILTGLDAPDVLDRSIAALASSALPAKWWYMLP